LKTTTPWKGNLTLALLPRLQDYLRRKKLMSTVCSMEEETGMHSKEPVQVRNDPEIVTVLISKQGQKMHTEACGRGWLMGEVGLTSSHLQEIKILKDLVLKGKWSEAETFIETIEASDGAAYNKVTTFGGFLFASAVSTSTFLFAARQGRE
jgi:hypothetical protein